MFQSAPVVNSDTSGWDVSGGTVNYMFNCASAFSHALCWDVAGKTTTSML